MLKFISFGSGSSGNSYMLFTETDGLLIDAGVGIRLLKKHLHESGLKIDQVNNILITHDHADHIKSVGVISSEYNIPVHAPRNVHVGIVNNYCVHKKIPADLVKIIDKDVRIKVGDFYVTPFAVPHDSTCNVGYKVEYDGVVFCLITDAGHITEEMKKFIGEANYLVIEADYDKVMLKDGPYPDHLKVRIAGPTGHLSNEDCGEAIANNATEALRHVWLCHLSEENNHPVLAQKTVEQVLRSYGLIAGKDFNVDVLKRKTASEIYELK